MNTKTPVMTNLENRKLKLDESEIKLGGRWDYLGYILWKMLRSALRTFV